MTPRRQMIAALCRASPPAATIKRAHAPRNRAWKDPRDTIASVLDDVVSALQRGALSGVVVDDMAAMSPTDLWLQEHVAKLLIGDTVPGGRKRQSQRATVTTLYFALLLVAHRLIVELRRLGDERSDQYQALMERALHYRAPQPPQRQEIDR